MGAGRRNFAGLAIVLVFGPCPGREEGLVVPEVVFAVEQIVHAAVVSFHEGLGMIQEGKIDALSSFRQRS